jgi:hypothetical protein
MVKKECGSGRFISLPWDNSGEIFCRWDQLGAKCAPQLCMYQPTSQTLSRFQPRIFFHHISLQPARQSVAAVLYRDLF